MIGTSFTASEVAKLARMTRQHLTRLCRQGEVPGAFRTKGGHWRVSPSKKLNAWLGRPDVSPKNYDDILLEVGRVAAEQYQYEVAAAAINRTKRRLERRLRVLAALAKTEVKPKPRPQPS